MTEKEQLEWIKKVDQGVIAARKIVWEEARLHHWSLVILKDHKIVEVTPDRIPDSAR